MNSTSGSLTATGSVTLTKDHSHTLTLVQLAGTYGTVNLVLEATVDGTNWFPVVAYNYGSNALATGTLAPTDDSEVVWQVPSAGLTSVRARVTAISSGTAEFYLQSASYVGFPPIVNLSSATFGATTFSGTVTVSSAAIAHTSTSASAYAVGPNGTTNPTLQVDASTASAATGLKVKSAAAASGLALSVVSSGTNENLTVDAKGSGTVTIGGTSTGNVLLGGGGGRVVVPGTLTAGGLLTCAVQVATSGPLVYSGSGAPTISAAVKGSIYMRTDGSTTNNRFYVATDTSGTWTAVTTAA